MEDLKRIDTANNNTTWWNDVCDEIRKSRIAFGKFEGDKFDLPQDYTETNCHLIFMLKWEKV